MENLVGIGVTNTAQEPWVSECPLERVVLPPEHIAETFQVGVQNFQTARFVGSQLPFPSNHMQGRSPFGARLGKNQGAGVKVKRSQPHPTREFRSGFFPMETACDHEVKHQKQILNQADDYAFAQPPYALHHFALDLDNGWIEGAKQKRTD